MNCRSGTKYLALLLFPLALLTGCAPAAESGPAQPAELAAIVEKAARERDLQILSEHMVDNFSYSFGRDPSRTEALARYRTQPELLDKMANALAQECAFNRSGSETYYVCPAAAVDEEQAYYGWRAGFRQNDNADWEFVWFIAGD